MQSSREPVHRCFYGITFPHAVNVAVSGLIANLERHDHGAVRWTPPANLHLTLRFLGELERRRFSEARQVMIDATLPPPFTLGFGPTNAFPSLRKPRVLVLDLEERADTSLNALQALQTLTESFARALGLEPEERSFRPHLTLGRVRRGEELSLGLRKVLETMTVDIPDAKVDQLLLIESKMSREGAKYRIVEKRELRVRRRS
ncbi:MAG: RNA 2',3'-cyclic phosphodiesterase [Chlorobi bacterium]|nr:RNA 2',3'-cyclic phosphodiesterase [Chlorobiota bacterium]